MGLMIIKQYYTQNPCLAAGDTSEKTGIQLHTIGCAQGTAESVYQAMNQPGYQAGVHYIVDCDQPGKVLQTMPETARAWADGGYGNDHLIAFEICESDHMRYQGGAAFAILDEAAFRRDITTGYETAVLLCADICRRYGWNPKGKLPSGLYVISSHDEGRRAGLSTAHVDPTHVWSRTGFTMDQFRTDVEKALKGTLPETGYYKVQVGAFRDRRNADKLCAELKAKGYPAFVSKPA